jgi:hypothetical protein
MGKRQVSELNPQVKATIWQEHRFSLKKVIEKASPDRESRLNIKDNDLSQGPAWLFQG